jgi:oligopeptide/dipeptide ABC transporter ATP-binding protein
MPEKDEILLEVKGLRKYYPLTKGLFSRVYGHVKAVDGIDFFIKKGETLGLVGESGSGKTTTGRCILRLVDPTSGEILFEGKNLLQLDGSAMRAMRRKMQVIFQDPQGSLNPRMTVGSIVAEPLIIHKMARGKEKYERTAEILETVGLDPKFMKRYPHEFSGGQRQRIGIARAIALKPSFIVADEPVSALDVSVQAQVLNLLMELQEKFGLTYLFIAHDLSVVKHISNRIAVMYLGKLCEIADARELYRTPRHPYTQALLSSIPVPDPAVKPHRILLEGDIPSPANPPSGCRFRTRCPMAREICREQEPALEEKAPNHFVSCHFA